MLTRIDTVEWQSGIREESAYTNGKMSSEVNISRSTSSAQKEAPLVEV